MKPKWLAALAATGVLFAQSTDVEDPGVQQMAANAYAAKYGVSVSAATARLQLQDRASGIEDRLESMLGQQYAGVWFDAAKQGRLQVGIAPGAVGSEAAIRGLLAAYNLSADTDLVSVTYTAEQLLQRQRSISASIGDIVAAGKARIHSDPKRNRVGVVAIQSLSANDESRIAQIGQMPDVYLRRTNHPNEKITFNACTIGRCNPPLLGGRASDGCTLGFMARDRDTNGRRVVTAGHCTFLFSSANWNAQNEAGSWKSIGAGAGTWFAGGAGDGGVIANSGVSWQRPAPIGMVLWRPVASIALDYQYPIRGDASGVVGRFVCRTGMTTGSECGEISLLNADNTGELNGVNYTVSGLTEVDMCAAAAGDSGGPYFKNKKAYGVQSGTQKFGTTSCFEVFQPIRVLKYVFDLDLVLAP